jgi:hypothetical protein
MALLNWSMTIMGYPAHARSGVRMVGLTHMSTFAVMRFLEASGVVSGWLMAEGAQPQLERVRSGAATWVGLTDLFRDRRVVKTEGLANGRLVFAAATTAPGGGGTPTPPPSDRPITAWAESRGALWVEIVDNEYAYWGNLDDQRLGQLLAWFICQRPLDADWKQQRLDARTFALLRHGLFEHGWTRNLGLARPDRATTDLWGGVHRACLLEGVATAAPISRVQTGVRVRLDAGEISAKELAERCPLSDETGKTGPR